MANETFLIILLLEIVPCYNWMGIRTHNILQDAAYVHFHLAPLPTRKSFPVEIGMKSTDIFKTANAKICSSGTYASNSYLMQQMKLRHIYTA